MRVTANAIYKGGFFMTLKEQVKNIVRDSTKKREQEEREKEKALIRSDEELKAIDEYLENLLKELAANPLNVTVIRFSKYIEIDCTCRSRMHFTIDSKNEYIGLAYGARIEITHEDIQRFCKQHKFKLNYIVKGSYDWERVFSKKYFKYGRTKAYLIRV